MYDITCGAVASKLKDNLKYANISVSYNKSDDKINVRIKHKFFEREFQTGFSFATELIMSGHSGSEIADSVIRQYRKWVRNNFFVQ